MKSNKTPVKCYIAAFNNPKIDPFLQSQGFTRGMICFAIPAFGILFRCRTEGGMADLEFSAFFSLLEFVSTKLKDEKISSVQVCSSSPNLVFSFTKDSAQMAPGSARRQLLAKYSKAMTISVAYVKPTENKALLSPAEYASVPTGQTVKLNIDPAELGKVEFRPFQKGVKLS